MAVFHEQYQGVRMELEVTVHLSLKCQKGGEMRQSATVPSSPTFGQFARLKVSTAYEHTTFTTHTVLLPVISDPGSCHQCGTYSWLSTNVTASPGRSWTTVFLNMARRS